MTQDYFHDDYMTSSRPSEFWSNHTGESQLPTEFETEVAGGIETASVNMHMGQ
jgi:hypothetical protein